MDRLRKVGLAAVLATAVVAGSAFGGGLLSAGAATTATPTTPQKTAPSSPAPNGHHCRHGQGGGQSQAASRAPASGAPRSPRQLPEAIDATPAGSSAWRRG